MLHEPPTDDTFLALEASLSERHREPKSILATDADLVAYAGKALLNEAEAIALIQGFKRRCVQQLIDKGRWWSAILMRASERHVAPMGSRG